MVKKIEKLSKNPDLVQYIKDEKLRKIAYEMDMKESKETGYSEGRESGYSEGVIETVRNLIKEKADINIVSKATGMTVDEIKKLAP